MRTIAGALLLVLSLSGSAWAQFCAEDDIVCIERYYQLEETLFAYEQLAGRTLGAEASQCLADDSGRWHADLARLCLGDACREAAFADRLSSLAGLVPGAGPLDGVDFVPTMALVTVLAPEAEAADPADFAPADIVGTLVHAGAEPDHMGLAASDDAGAHVIVFDMDIGNQSGHATLQDLIADEPGRRFLVRGSIDELGNFLPSQCRLVYRLPD